MSSAGMCVAGASLGRVAGRCLLKVVAWVCVLLAQVVKLKKQVLTRAKQAPGFNGTKTKRAINRALFRNTSAVGKCHVRQTHVSSA